MKTAVYPGSFDPITNGHLDIIKRSAAVFDRVIVGVLKNSEKHYMFSPEERAELILSAAEGIKNVEVHSFDGLLVDFMKKFESSIIVKGLRTVADFEYEFQMALLNKSLNPETETFFMMTNSKYSYISSSMVKEVYGYGGCINDFVPECVIRAMNLKAKNGGEI